MSERDKRTPTSKELAELAASFTGEETRPGCSDSETRRAERRRSTRESVRELAAVGSPKPRAATAVERLEALELRMLMVEEDQTRLSQRLLAVEQREKAMGKQLAELHQLLLTDRGAR